MQSRFVFNYPGAGTEIFVDNIIKPNKYLHFSRREWYRLEIAKVLFHEIGHHIHRTKVPEHREPENVADKYMMKYWLKFIRRNWFRFIVMMLHTFVALFLQPQLWGKMWSAVHRKK